MRRETSIRSMGHLYVMIGVVLVAVGALVADLRIAEDLLRGALFAICGIVLLAVGVGMDRLSGWSRRPAIVLACIGLFVFPLGTVLSGYLLFLLLNRTGRLVFTPVYREAVAATVGMRATTSPVVWVFIGLFFLALAAVVVPVMLRRM